MKKRYRLSLVWKISTFMTAIIFVLVMFMIILYIQTHAKSTESDSRALMEQSLGQIKQNIYSGLDDVQAYLDNLCYKQEFSYFLNGKNNLSESEIQFYIFNLESQRTTARYLYNNQYGNFGIYSSNKQIDEKKYEWQFYLDTLKKKPYYREITDDEDEQIYGKIRNADMFSTSLKTSMYNMGDTSTMVLPVYRKVYDLNTKEMLGVIEIDLDVSRLANSMETENESGNIVMDCEKSAFLVDTMQCQDSLQKKIARGISEKSGSFGVKDNGSYYEVVYHRMDDINLIAASVICQDEQRAYIYGRIVLMLVTGVLCLLPIFGGVYYFVHNMLKRLLILDHMMGKVGEGNFEVAIVDDKVGDELTRITRSFNKMAARLEDVMKQKIHYEQAQKEAEIRALQAQINPHFLYNTLETMRMQCEIDEYYLMSNSLSALGELFRYSISWGSNAVRFELEWMNLKNYISIMQMRYGDTLEFVLEKDEGLDDIIVPKLIIQPLIENSFNHGFKRKLPPWYVKVSAKNMEKAVVIIIKDNGIGIAPERMERLIRCLNDNIPFRNEEKHKNSIGVTNVKQRIDMLCKPGSTLSIVSQEGEGTSITLTILK